MKYDINFKVYMTVYLSFIKKDYPKNELANLKKEYIAIVERAKDIGSKNRLLGSYAMAAFFIAMHRTLSGDIEEKYENFRRGMSKSSMYKLAIGDGSHYFDEKKMIDRRKWSAETHLKKYENDWVVDILEKNDKYDLGYDYYECGACKLCKDEGCPEIAKYLCKLDFLLVELMDIGFARTTTLAEGGEKCDFRFTKKS